MLRFVPHQDAIAQQRRSERAAPGNLLHRHPPRLARPTLDPPRTLLYTRYDNQDCLTILPVMALSARLPAAARADVQGGAPWRTLSSLISTTSQSVVGPGEPRSGFAASPK